MSARRRAIVPLCLVALAGSASAEAKEDARAIADRYLAAMTRKGYAFLSKNELERRREEVEAFVTKHLGRPLDEPARAAVLSGIDRCLDRLYSTPAGTVHYFNGFGSGGEEWVYLNDRDYFRTFQYHLWVGLTREPLPPADVQRRDSQREWMREYLTYGPWRETQPVRNEKIRPKVLAELEKSFADPLGLLYEPLPDDTLAELRERFRDNSSGIDGDLHQMRVAALTSRFPWQKDAAGRAYAGRLPFDDTVVALWGNAPHLCFASNAGFRGSHGGLSASDVYDVLRCDRMRADPAPAPMSAAMDAWLATERRGELTLDGLALVPVRGARVAELPVKNWFDADKLSDDELRAAIRNGGRDRIPIERLPTMNGPHRGDRTEGEFFAVVQSREDRLAVINLYVYEFNELMFWCRPRAARP